MGRMSKVGNNASFKPSKQTNCFNNIRMILNLYRKILSENIKYVRYKHKENHWSIQRKKKTGPMKALEHFDDFYKQVYGHAWPSIRQGLLGTRKYICVLNNYADIEMNRNRLENNGAINIRRIFEVEKGHESANKLKRLCKDRLSKIYSMEREINTKLAGPDAKANEHLSLTLAESMRDAEIDASRVIDPKNPHTIANLHEFIPTTQMKGNEDFIPESAHYNYYEQNHDYPVKMIPEIDLHYPENLETYCFPDVDQSFEPPKMGTTGVLDYYLLDGASLLPILALDLTPGCSMLDLCSAPGGKSLMAVQTLYPNLVVSNDVTTSRSDRIYRVYKQYLYDFNKKWLMEDKIRLTIQDGRYLTDGGYDRILVDAPCTTDRHSIFEEDNNIFRSNRIKERLQLPELQRDLLANALQLVKIDGIVVYSTCSLSPIQNDGVVHMALKKIFQEAQIEVAIMDLNVALRQVKSVFSISKPNFCKYGNVVLPNVDNNYGPMYFCKLRRIK